MKKEQVLWLCPSYLLLHSIWTGGDYFLLASLMILSGKTAALIKSAGSISKASAMLKKISRENGRTIPGASIALIWDRLTFAFSANCSWDIPRNLRSADIAIPSWINRSLFLKEISYAILSRLHFLIYLKYCKHLCCIIFLYNPIFFHE